MTPTQRKAVEQALEVLDRAGSALGWQAIGQVERELRAALAEQPAEQELVADKRMKVKLGGTYGHELVGHWFYLHPADEFAEKALEQRTGISAPKPAKRLPLTDRECINEALNAGFERNSLGWSFTYGQLDYHLLKFARAIERAHGITGETNGETK